MALKILAWFNSALSCSKFIFLALIVPLPVNKFPNKLAPKVSNNIQRNPPFYPFAPFWIVSLTPFINKPDSSSDLTIIHFIVS